MSKKTKIAIAVVVITVIGGFIFFAINNANSRESASGISKNAFPVDIEKSHKETIVTKVTAKGGVEIIKKDNVYATSTGKINKLNVKLGDVITKDMVLLTYDDKSLQTLQNQLQDAELALKAARLGLSALTIPASESELSMADAKVKQAEKSIDDINYQVSQLDSTIARLERDIQEAEKKFSDNKALFEKGVIAQKELTAYSDNVKQLKDQLETQKAQRNNTLLSMSSAERTLSAAKSDYSIVQNKSKEASNQNRIAQQQVSVEQASLRIEQIKKEINDFKTEEVSEVEGVVTALYTAEGETAATGKVLMEISKLSYDNLVIKVNVPENKASAIAVGQKVELRGDALGKNVYEGVLSKINPIAERKQIGNSTETVVTVEISLKEENPNIRPGYTIETAIVTNTTEDAVCVPLMATRMDDEGNDYVYIMKSDYSVEKRIIKLGEYSGIYVAVDSVAEGENVIMTSAPQITEGSFVKPISGVDSTNSTSGSGQGE